MSLSIIMCLLFCLLSAVLCSMDLVRRHLAIVNKMPCEKPQPRFVYLKDLLTADEWNNKYKKIRENLLPRGTFIYKCHSSGCCAKYNERCVATEFDNDTVIFGTFGRPYHEIRLNITHEKVCECKPNSTPNETIIK